MRLKREEQFEQDKLFVKDVDKYLKKNLTYREIGELMGKHTSTIYNRYAFAKARLSNMKKEN